MISTIEENFCVGCSRKIQTGDPGSHQDLCQLCYKGMLEISKAHMFKGKRSFANPERQRREMLDETSFG